MSFGDAVNSIFHIDISSLQQELNPSVFSWDSLPGVIVLLIIVGMVVLLGRKVGRMLWYGFVLVVLIEIMHIFAFSTIGTTYLPFLQEIFKYHILQSLAQLCVGTHLATGLLFIQEFLNSVVGLAFEALLLIWNLIYPVFKFAWDNITNVFGH